MQCGFLHPPLNPLSPTTTPKKSFHQQIEEDTVSVGVRGASRKLRQGVCVCGPNRGGMPGLKAGQGITVGLMLGQMSLCAAVCPQTMDASATSGKIGGRHGTLLPTRAELCASVTLCFALLSSSVFRWWFFPWPLACLHLSTWREVRTGVLPLLGTLNSPYPCPPLACTHGLCQLPFLFSPPFTLFLFRCVCGGIKSEPESRFPCM